MNDKLLTMENIVPSTHIPDADYFTTISGTALDAANCRSPSLKYLKEKFNLGSHYEHDFEYINKVHTCKRITKFAPITCFPTTSAGTRLQVTISGSILDPCQLCCAAMGKYFDLDAFILKYKVGIRTPNPSYDWVQDQKIIVHGWPCTKSYFDMEIGDETVFAHLTNATYERTLKGWEFDGPFEYTIIAHDGGC